MQVLKFMDTRIRKIFQRIFLTCFIIHVSTNLQSQDFEKEYLTTQLKKHHGNISKTADFIGMERSPLHRKLKSLGIKGIN